MLQTHTIANPGHTALSARENPPVQVDSAALPNPSESDAIALLTSTYEEDYRALATYLYRRTGDHDLAGELASETYSKALASIGQWTHQGLPLRHWLFRIATRRLAHYRRAQARRARLFSMLGRRYSASRSSSTPSPDSDMIVHALQRLPTDRQDVLYLHHVEGLSIDEVACTLDIPPGTVKSRLARARAELATHVPTLHTPLTGSALS